MKKGSLFSLGAVLLYKLIFSYLSQVISIKAISTANFVVAATVALTVTGRMKYDFMYTEQYKQNRTIAESYGLIVVISVAIKVSNPTLRNNAINFYAKITVTQKHNSTFRKDGNDKTDKRQVKWEKDKSQEFIKAHRITLTDETFDETSKLQYGVFLWVPLQTDFIAFHHISVNKRETLD